MLRDTLPMCIPPFFRHIYTVSAVCGILWEWRVKWWWNFDDWEKFFNFVAAFANAMLFSMRGILVFVIGFVMLAAAVGCGDAHYDARLAALDSIIEERPDSALAGLRALGFGVFSRSDDRAYFALLLTEAQYKCYDSIASTDTIDLAVSHFTGNGDREKLTRSLIFKGATLEELGNPTDAMRFYKQAEETALSTDYHNLGYANLRMASLYHECFSTGREYIDKYHKTLKYSELGNLNNLKLVALSRLGAVYRGFHNDSSYHYLNRAIHLSDSLNDSISYFRNICFLSRAYYTDSLYSQLKAVSLYAIKNGSRYINNDIYHDLIRAYSLEGNTDSAKMYLKYIDNREDRAIGYLSYLFTMKIYSAAKGDYKQACYYSQLDEKLSDSLKNARNSAQLIRVETEFERKNAILQAKLVKSESIIFITISCFCIIVLLFIIIVLRIKYKSAILSKQMLIASLKEDFHEVEAALLMNKIELEENKKHNEINDFTIKSLHEAFESQLEKTQRVMKLAENAGALKPDVLGKRINSILFSKMDDNEIMSLIKYVNLRFGNVLNRLIEKYPNLSKTDIKIITMMYLGYPNSYICVFMGYTNKQSVINRKQIIAQKLGIEQSLSDFLKNF